jgi:hypothetical protein
MNDAEADADGPSAPCGSLHAGDAAWRAQLTQAYEALAAHEQPLNAAHRKSWDLSAPMKHSACSRWGFAMSSA